MQPKILGVFEKVDFPEFNILNVSAKIDSGAYTGALHCTSITKEKTPGGNVLHFSPFDYPNIKITAKKYHVGYVKSSNGTKERRYFIKTSITVQGETYDIILTLADRSNMKVPVIIGRRFVSKHKFLLDVNKSFSKNLIRQKVEKI